MSHYDVLGTSPDADAETLRRAFVAMARRFHPDRHIGAAPAVRRDAERRMREITEAWAVLGDPVRRERYDLGMGDRIPGPAGSGRSGTGARPAAGNATGAGAAGSGPTGGRGATAEGGSAATGASGSGERAASTRDWRTYASPGPGGASRRSTGEQLALLSPALLLGGAAGFGLFGAIIGWPPFFALALVCVIGAAAAFFMLPIWAMTRGSHKRAGRGPKRSY